jgi:NADH-quinone oxidoreductase subunit A
MFKFSYISIFTFFVFCSVLSSIIFFLSYSVSLKEEDPEKLSIYECGFNPFTDSKNEFSVKFFLVAILFIIFDLEISFLFPYSASIDTIGYLGCFSMIFFLVVLTVGFLYEWQKGALD